MSLTSFMAFCILGLDLLIYVLFHRIYGDKRSAVCPPSSHLQRAVAKPFWVVSQNAGHGYQKWAQRAPPRNEQLNELVPQASTVHLPTASTATDLRNAAHSPRATVTGPAVRRCRPVGRDTRAYLESQDDHRMRMPAHMARAVLEAYPDDEPVVSRDPRWRTL